MSERPTHARYWVIFYAVTLAILSYINRVAISQAAPDIVRDLKFTDVQMGRIFGAFALSYALFEVPTGWLGDWIGPRKVLLRIVLWWSAFTAITGAMWNFSSMWIARFLFGAGEAGGFPNLTKAFTTWLPKVEHVRAQGIMWTFARWGGALTPVLVVWVLRFVNWHWAFVMFGGLGVIWAFFFARWYRDNPADHPSVNAAELALLKGSERLAAGHAKVPWGKLLRSRSIWLLWLQYFCSSFPWYFNITWLPTYLQQHWKLAPAEAARFAILPLFFGGMGALFCGSISASFARRVGLARSRRILATCRILRRREFPGAGHPISRSQVGDALHGHGQLLQRPRHAAVLGRLHGHRWQIRRHSFRIDEHDGQPGRLRVARDRRLHLTGNRPRLERLPLRAGGGIPGGHGNLALYRSGDGD